MKPLSPTDLDDLYIYAQLVADDAEEANAFLRTALDAREQGDRAEADVLIRRIAGSALNESGAWLARRQVPSALEDLLPKLMARIRPSRRLAVVKAFRDDGSESSDRSVFFVLVKRALETDGLNSAAKRLTPEGLEESMRRYLDSQMAPVPDRIRLSWEERFRPVRDESLSRKRSFPLPARIAAGVLIILLSAAIGSWITSPGADSPTVRSELFDALSGLETDGPEFRASDSEQVERFIADRLDWRVSVPRLREGGLEGVSVARLSADLQLPIIHYNDLANEEELRVLIVDYRFLENARTSYLVDGRILDQIADPGGVDIRNAPGFYRVTWRFRDDIYVAMGESVDPDLRDRFDFD